MQPSPNHCRPTATGARRDNNYNSNHDSSDHTHNSIHSSNSSNSSHSSHSSVGTGWWEVDIDLRRRCRHRIPDAISRQQADRGWAAVAHPTQAMQGTPTLSVACTAPSLALVPVCTVQLRGLPPACTADLTRRGRHKRLASVLLPAVWSSHLQAALGVLFVVRR